MPFLVSIAAMSMGMLMASPALLLLDAVTDTEDFIDRMREQLCPFYSAD